MADFRVLFDVDNNQATGCTVSGLAGVDQVLLTRVETVAAAGSTPASARVILTQRQICSGGSLGAPVDVNTTGWAARFNQNTGEVVAETRIPFTAFNVDGSMPRGMRLGFEGINGAAVHKAFAATNGTPVIYPPLANGKRRSVVDDDREFILDGQDADWGRIKALLQGLAGSGSPALRLLRIFTHANPLDKHIYFRFEAFVDASSPFANDDEYNRTQGSGLSVAAPGVLANDADPSGQPLTALPVSTPQHGDVTLNPDGSFTYAPQNPASTQTDTFEYKATNGAQESNIAKVTISVASVANHPPVAQNDSFNAAEDTPIDSPAPGVLANDSDADGDPLTATLVSPPANGSLTLNANGSFTYLPAANFFGTDTFIYNLSDGTNTVSATVTITLAPVNDAPVVTGATFTLPENSPVGTVVGDVSVGDVDSSNFTFTLTDPSGAFAIDPNTGRITVANATPLNFEANASFTFDVAATDDGTPPEASSNDITVSLTDVNDVPVVQSATVTTDEDIAVGTTLPATDQDGDALTYIILAEPLHGTLSGTAPNLTYTPDENFYGNDSIIFIANDGDSDSTTATVSIVVNPINDPPIAGVDVFATTPGTGLTISPAAGVLANDFDAEGDALMAVIVDPPSNGVITFNDDGGFSYMPNVGFSGIDTFSYDVVEATSAAATLPSALRARVGSHAATTVSINVSATNQAPVANNQSVSTNEDTSRSITLTGSDPDGHAIRFDIATQPAHGRVVGNNAVVRYFPDDNYNGPDSFTFTVTDGFAVSSAATVSITVTPVNDAPMAAEDVYGVAQGNTLVVPVATGVLANDTDIEGTTLTATVTQLPVGTLSFNPNGSFNYSPQPGFVGVDHFRYRASDGSLQSQITKVSINVRTGNAAPTANNISVNTTEDTAVGFTVTGSDPDGDGLQFTATTSPANGTLGGLPPNFVYTPNQNFNGTDSFQFTASDGLATSPAATVFINIAGVNDPPVAVDDAFSTNEETLVTGAVLTNDTDVDGAGPTIAALDLDVQNGTLVFNSDGTFEYTPDANFVGNDYFSYRANDGIVSSNLGLVTITVNGVNDPPSFTSGGNVTVLEDSGAYSAAWATGISAGPGDESGQTLTFNVTANSNPTLFSAGPTIASNGTLSFTPAANANGSANITVTLSDNGGGTNTSAPQSFTINVTAVNDEPSFTSGGDVTVLEDSGAYSNAWATGINKGQPDESAQTVSFNITNNTNATLFSSGPTILADGTLNFTPNANLNGFADITVNMQDTGGTANGGDDTSASVTFRITVTGVNDEPSFTSGGNVTVLEDSGAYSAAWATGLSTGPSDESGQTLNFTVDANSNTGLFASGPSIAANGTLSFTLNANVNGSANITVSVGDDGGTANGGDNTSAQQTFTITVTPVNDEPSFTAGSNVSVAEDSGAYSASWASAMNKGQADESSQTLSFVFTANDNTGLFQAGPAIDATTGVLTFTPAANANGTANVTVELRDDGGTANGGDDTSASVSFQITVTPVNDAPTVTAGSTRSYSEGGAAVTLEPSFTITDIDSSNIQGATVSISLNADLGNDVLACPACGGTITASYNAGSGVLTLSGTDTIANYQTALRSVTFSNTSDNPSTAVRGIDWFVTDDSGAPNVDNTSNDTTVNFTAVNDAPVNTVPGAQTINEDNPATFAGTISISDADAGTASVQVTLGSTNGTLTLSGTTGLTFTTGDGTGDTSMVFTGSISDINTALNGLVFDPTPDFFGTGTVSITTNDQGNSGTGGALGSGTDSVTINIINVNDVPVLTAGGTLNYTENDAATAIDTTVTVSDIDDTNIESATVQITGNYVNGEDVLSYVDVAPISGSFNAATGTLTLTGSDTLADYQTALRSVKYNNTSNNPSTSARTVTFIANDGDGNSASVTSTINVAAVNTAPVLTVANALAYTEGDGAVVVDNAITITDVDSTNLVGATVSVNGGYVNPYDVLSFTPVGSITGSFNATTGELILSGTDTVANYQTALRSVTYNSNTNDPEPQTSKQITFVVDDGGAVDNESNSEVVAVTVTPVNDAPAITAGATITYTEDDAATVIDNTITVSDPDDENVASTNLASATVSITGNFEVGDQLEFTDIAPITGSYNAGTGVLTLTGSDSVADYQAALRTVKFSSTLQDPSGLARTISWKVNDGTVDSNTATSTVNFTAVNDNPSITAGATLAYTENDTATVLDASIAISDVDDTDMASATVAITGNFASSEDVLACPACGGTITASYNAGTGVLSLSGTDTIANWETALESVTYQNTSNNPSTAARTITWTINDPNTGSGNDTSTVNITATNDAPVLTAGGTLAYTENDAATAIDTTVTVSDDDDTNIEGGTVTISGNYVNGEDVLSYVDVAPITGSFNAGTGTLTLSGSDSLADYQTALRSVMYANTSNNPTTAARTVTWTINDGDVNNGGTITSTINITATNDAPVLTAGGTLSYSEGDGAVVLDNTITVSDADDTNIEGATATISNNYQSGADALAFATIGAISGSFNAGTGVLTLTGSDTVANYQAALRTVTFNNTSDDPSTASRTITWTVNDGDANNSGTITSTVNLTATNDAPVNVMPAGQTTDEDTPLTLSGVNAIQISDPDAGSDSVQVTLSVTNGTFQTDVTATGLSITGDGTSTVTVTGSITNINDALDGGTFTPASNYSGAGAQIQIVTDDLGNNPSGSLTDTDVLAITVNNVNDAPVLSVTGALAFNEGDPAANLLTSANITDVDDTNIESATIQITGNYVNGQDVLSYVDVAPIAGSFNAASGTLTLTGSDVLADYITALQSVKYNNTSDNPSTAQRTVTWTVNDGDANNAGTITSTIDITATNDSPTMTAGGTLNYAESDPATAIDTTLTVTDPDSNITGATVTISANYNSGEDVLSLATIGAISGTFNSGTGVLTVIGTDTVANYQAALRTVKYENTSQNPSTTARTISWQVTDDAAATSVAVTSTVNVSNVNDAPVVTAGATLAYTENDPATVIDNTVTVTDVDHANLTGATVSISANFQSGADVLSFVDISPITGSYNAGTGVLTLSGTDSVANYQAALRTVKYHNTSEGPTTAARTISWVATDGVTPSAAATSTINITATNDAPVLSASDLVYAEGTGAFPLDSAMTLTDVDSSNLTGATVQITTNYVNGEDVLSFTNAPPITGSFNAATGTLTLSGTDSVANYQAALRAVSYNNTSDNPTTTQRVVTWTATDGTDSGNDTTTLDVTATNDAPTITAGATITFTEGEAAKVIDNTIVTNDVDDTNLEGATVSITANFQSGADVLSFTDISPITGSYNAGTGVLTLSGSDTVANYQAALRTVKFENTSQAPSTSARTISWVVDDGALSSVAATSTINVVSVNDAPVVTAGATLAYTENDAATVIDNTITISDVDSTNLTGATVQITGNYVNGQDVLSYVNVAPISGSFNAATGTLTLTGSDVLADYQTALRSVKYNNTSDDPSASARTVTWIVNDGGAENNLSAGVTSTINITAVNDPPTPNAVGPYDGQAGISITFPASTLGGTDLEAGTTVTVSTTPGTVTNGSVTINADGSFTFTPTSASAGGTASFQYNVCDNGNPGAGTCSTTPATVTFNVAGPAIYFVKSVAQGSGNCTLDNECTLATAVTNIGANTGRYIFISDANTHNTAVPLNTSGGLFGQGVTGTNFFTYFGIDSTPNAGGTLDTPPNINQTAPTIGSTVTLGSSSQVKGVAISVSSGTAMSGSGISSPTVAETSISASNATGLSLSSVTGASITLSSLAASGATNAVSFTSSTGTVTSSAGTLQNTTGAVINISGGSISFSHTGAVTQTNNAALLNVSGTHTGTLTLNGTISATNGSGLQFSDADGTYHINGNGGGSFSGNTTTLNGGDAAVDILSGSGGTFNFWGMAITSPSTGPGLNVSTSTSPINFNGSITIAANGQRILSIASHSTGAVSFSNGTLSATNGTGILFDNADSTYTFNASTTVTLNGGGTADTSLDITNSSNGSFTFSNASSSISNPSAGPAFYVNGSAPTSLSWPGSITEPSGRAIEISNSSAASCGTVTLSGTITASGSGATGILVNNCNAGTITFSGGTKTLNTQANSAVTISGNTASVVFSNGGLDIDTTSGTGISAASAGTLTISGSNNTILTTTGTAVNISGTDSGGITLQSVNVDGTDAAPTNAIVLSNTGSGSFTITGTGSANSGGTIQDTSGDAISLSGVANFSITDMIIQSNLGSGIAGSSVNGFVVDSCTISTNGDSSADDDAGIDIAGLTGSSRVGANPTKIIDSTLANNWEFQVQVVNTSGTLTDFYMSNNTITDDTSTGGGGNLVNVLGNTSAVMTVDIDGGTYTGNAPNSATAVHCDTDGGTMTVDISGGTYTNNNVAVNVSTSNSGNMSFDVHDIVSATGNRSHGLSLFVNASSTGTVSGKFRNNVVGTSGTAGSGSSVGIPIRVQNEGNTTSTAVTVLIDGNEVYESTSFAGINVNGPPVTGTNARTTNVTITNNQVEEIDDNRAIVVQQNIGVGTICANISGNSFANIAGNTGDGTVIRLRQIAGGTVNVTQKAASASTDAAELDDANGTTSSLISVGGSPTYNQSACPTP